jgi:hypothetical protein
MVRSRTGSAAWVMSRLSIVCLTAVFSSFGSAQELIQTRPSDVSLHETPARIWEQLKAFGSPTDAESQLLETLCQSDEPRATLSQSASLDQLLTSLLVASGQSDRSELERLRQKYFRLYQELFERVSQENDSLKQAERIMQFLYAKPFSGGYRAEQSSLATLLDTQQYNCVSSSALYYLLGHSLGLDLRVIDIPGTTTMNGHVCLELVLNHQRIPIEPTSPQGVNWKPELVGSGSLGFLPDRRRGVEAGPLGLVEMSFANRMSSRTQKTSRDYPAVARYGTLALAARPTPRAHSRLIGVFVNWSKVLLDEEKPWEALELLAMARRFAPDDRNLIQNQIVAFQNEILQRLRQNRDTQAVELVRRAHESLPSEKDFANPVDWFDRLVLESYGNQEYQNGSILFDRMAAALPEQATEIEQRRASYIQRVSRRISSNSLPTSPQVLAK